MKKSNTGLKIFLTIMAFIVAFVVFDVVMMNRISENLHVEYSDDDSALSGVVDKNGLFDNDPEKLEEINEIIQECSREIKMNILVFLPDADKKAFSDYQTEDFVKNYYNQAFAENTDGILYYMDISGKRPAYDYIATSAKANLVYNQSVRDSIFNRLDQYLPSSYSDDPIDADQISEAIDVFCGCLDSYNSEGIRESYYYDGNSYEPNFTYVKGGRTYVTKSIPPVIRLTIMLVCEFIGLIVALLVYFISKRNYKFKSKTNPRIYLPNDSVKFTVKTDTLTGTHTTSARIESSSGGGGGRSSHSGGSHGGSMGGSGHHR